MAGDLRRHHDHYDVNVMPIENLMMPSRGALEVIRWITSQLMHIHVLSSIFFFVNSSIISPSLICNAFPIFESALMKNVLKILQSSLVYGFIFMEQGNISRLTFIGQVRHDI